MDQVMYNELHKYFKEVNNVNLLKASLDYMSDNNKSGMFEETDIKKFINNFEKRIDFIYNGIQELNMFTLEEHIRYEYDDKLKRLGMSKLIISNKIYESIKENIDKKDELSELFKELKNTNYPVGSVLMSAIYLIGDDQKKFNSLYEIADKHHDNLKEKTLESCRKAKSEYSDPESLFLNYIKEYERKTEKKTFKMK